MYFGFLHIADGVYVLCYVYYIYKYIYDDSGYCATLYIRVQIALDLKRHTDTGCVWVCTTHQALGMTGLYLYVRPWAWALSGVADMWEKVLWMIELRNSGRTLFFFVAFEHCHLFMCSFFYPYMELFRLLMLFAETMAELLVSIKHTRISTHAYAHFVRTTTSCTSTDRSTTCVFFVVFFYSGFRRAMMILWCDDDDDAAAAATTGIAVILSRCLT